HRHRGDLREGRVPVDEEVRLLRPPRRRRGGGVRHSGHHVPSVAHHGHLRDLHRDQHRQAVRRRHPSGDRGRHLAVRRRAVHDVARSGLRPAGRALLLARALPGAEGRVGGGRALLLRHGRDLRRLLHGHRGRGHGRLRGHDLRAVAPRAHVADALRGRAGVREHYVDAVHAPDRRADLRGVRQHHDDAGGPQGVGHALQREPHRGGGGDLRGVRRARNGHGRAVDDPAHHPGVLPGHRAPGLRSDLVRHHHRVRGRDRPHQPAGGHEHVRAPHADPRGEHGDHLQRRAAVHVGRRPAPGHPRRVSVALALAPEHDAMKGGRLDRLSDWLVALRVLACAVAPEPLGARRLAAAVAALLFAVHPLRVESVAWITERRDVLCGLFFLLAVDCYLRAVEGDTRPRRGWYWSAVALAALALLSKAMAVTLPLVLLLLDVYPFRRLGPWRWTRRDVWLEKIPFFVLSAAAAVMAIVAQRSVGTLSDLRALGVFERLGLAAYGLVFYADKTLVPARLAPLYEAPYDYATLTAWFAGSAVVVVAAAVALVRVRRRWPGVVAAAAAFVVMLLPVLGLVHFGLHVAADRNTYFAGLAPAMLAGGVGLRGLRGAR